MIEPSARFLACSHVLNVKTQIDTKQKTIHLCPLNPAESPHTIQEETIVAWYGTVEDVNPRKRSSNAYCSVDKKSENKQAVTKGCFK